MIDTAAPLGGLGGVIGPMGVSGDLIAVKPGSRKSVGEEEEKHVTVSSEEEAGAVPGELLDLQDDLDMEVGAFGDRVGWCKDLERQCRR